MLRKSFGGAPQQVILRDPAIFENDLVSSRAMPSELFVSLAQIKSCGILGYNEG
jgi:hypothetical protein